MEKLEYIINKKEDSSYEIHKFLWGSRVTTYKYTRKRGCGCASGIYRNTCKHKDWIRLLEQGKPLPSGVVEAKTITQKDLNEL